MSAVADFDIADGQRFGGDFSFAASPVYLQSMSAAESTYVECVREILDRMAAEPAGPEGLAEEIDAIRALCCGELRRQAKSLAEGLAGVERDALAGKLFRRALRLEGSYLERVSHKREIPFVVDVKRAGPGEPIVDLIVSTRDVPIAEDKQRFKVEIDRTVTVMKTVLGGRTQRGWWTRPETRAPSNSHKLDEYLGAVAGIAKVGLMNLDRSQTPFAELALTGLKDEFLAREAGLVKNAYVRRLGVAAIVAVVLCVAGFAAASLVVPDRFAGLLNFFWLWAGAAVGAWLSFSIRRSVLTFSDLAVLEEDRLSPEFRIAFVLALTTVIGLLFWTGMAEVTIGEFTTNFELPANGDVALLIGALCGIAERSMASAVGRRAEDFAASVGTGGEATR